MSHKKISKLLLPSSLEAIESAELVAAGFASSEQFKNETDARLAIADLISNLAEIKIRLSSVEVELSSITRINLELSLENEKLARELDRLNKKYEDSKLVSYSSPFYYLANDDQPLCPKCKGGNDKIVHLTKHEKLSGFPSYSCPVCDYTHP